MTERTPSRGMIGWGRARWKQLAGVGLLVAFVALNALAYLHAGSMTRFVESGTKDDIFPVEASVEAVKKVTSIYGVFGAAGLVEQEVAAMVGKLWWEPFWVPPVPNQGVRCPTPLLFDDLDVGGVFGQTVLSQ